MESNNYSNRPQKKSNLSGVAVFLICIGSLFLLFNLNILPNTLRPIILSWQMLLIILGIWNMTSKKNPTAGIIMIVFGAFFLYPKIGILLPYSIFNLNISTFWPVMLIIIGLVLIANHNKKSSERKRLNRTQFNSQTDDSDRTAYLDKSIMFNSSEQIILSQNFKGGDANIMFGELIIDLRKAKLAEGNYLLELNAMFGSMAVYVPTDWTVEVQGSSFLGSFDDKRYAMNTENIASGSILVIKGNTMFASIDIKN